MRKIILLIAFIFLAKTHLFAQATKIDSLVKVLAVQKEDTSKVKTLNALAAEYIEKAPDKAIESAQLALTLAEKLKFQSGIATAYSNLGNTAKSKADFESALDYLQKALKINESLQNKKAISTSYNDIGNVYWTQGKMQEALKFNKQAYELKVALNDQKGLALVCNSIGGIYSDQGDYAIALEYYLKSLKILEKINLRTKLPIIYNNIGNIYRNQNKYTEALTYFFKSLAIAKEIGNRKSEANTYNKIGTVYDNQGKYEDAISYYNQSLQIKREIGDKKGIADTYNNIGVLYKYRKDYTKALDFLLKSLAIKEEIGDNRGLINSNSNVGSVYARMGNFTKAYFYLNAALKYAKMAGAKDMIRDNYFMFSETYAMQKNYAKAYEFQLRYDSIKDKVLNEISTQQIAEMQSKYESEKKESEIQLLTQNSQIKNLEIGQQKLQIQKRNYLLIASLITLIILIVSIYFWIGKQKLKNELDKEITIKETEELERIRIARDIHDDLGSGLSKINFLSELVVNQTQGQGEVKHNVESIAETAKRMVDNMRDLIWALNPENTTLANLIARVREYSSDYLEDFPVELISNFPDNIPQFQITKESHRGIFMVIKESLNNSVKHAQASQIKIDALLDDKNISISIADNGNGFTKNAKESGNGLRNMKSRIEAAGGTFDLESEKGKGTKIIISLALDKVIKK